MRQEPTVETRHTLLIALVAIFVTCLVVGDLIGGKLSSFDLFGRTWVFSVGQLAFPVTFILTDILNEFYGQRVVRRVTFLAFFMVGLTFCIIYLAAKMPWWSVATQPSWDGVHPSEFTVVFTQATRIQLSSMAAFLLANLVDISAFFVIKRLTGNRFLWLRSTGSTAISQLIDTVLITALAFGSKMTFDQYVSAVVASYLIKLAAAILITPVIYGVHEVVEKRLGLHPVHVEPDAPPVGPPATG